MRQGPCVPLPFLLSALLSFAARSVMGQSAWWPLPFLFLRLRLRLRLLLLLTLDFLRRLSLLPHLHLWFRSLRRLWSGNARLLLRFRSLWRWLRSHRASFRLCSRWWRLRSHHTWLWLCSRWWRRRFLWRLLLDRRSYITASWSGLRLRLSLINVPSRLHVVANAFALRLLRRALSALLRRRLFALLLFRLSLLLPQLLHLLARYSVATRGFS
jgi:hypothetical protein